MLNAICLGFRYPTNDPSSRPPALKCNDSPEAEKTCRYDVHTYPPSSPTFTWTTGRVQPENTSASLPCPRAAVSASVVLSFMHGGMVELTHGRED